MGGRIAVSDGQQLGSARKMLLKGRKDEGFGGGIDRWRWFEAKLASGVLFLSWGGGCWHARQQNPRSPTISLLAEKRGKDMGRIMAVTQ